MKSLIFITLYLLSFSVYSNPLQKPDYDIMVELGEDYSLQHVKQKVWIENPKIFSAVPQGNGIKLKPLALGYSKIKADQKVISALVVPQGFKESYAVWTHLVRKMPNVAVSFCEQTICLKGSIFKLAEFQKIIEIMDQKKSYLFLKLNLSESLTAEIEKWYIQYFRNHEITPPKIVFNATPWKAILSSKDDQLQNNTLTHEVGLFTQENKNKLEISDNIKVSVKFLEIKKSLSRKLGLEFPGQISGQLNSSGLHGPQSLDVLLDASEQQGNSHTLANPSLICRNGKEADFFAGGEIPIKIISYKAQNVVWKKYGIDLKIKPLVDPSGQMSLDISSEVTTIDHANSADGIPGVQTNKISSHFDLTKSKTIVLSGLIQNGHSTADSGLAYLTQLPILGRLFSSREFQNNESELIILVTPEIYE